MSPANAQIFSLAAAGFGLSTSAYFMLMLFSPGLRERWLRRGFITPVPPDKQRAVQLMIGANAGMFFCMSLGMLARWLPPSAGAWQGALDMIAQWAPLGSMGFAASSILMFQRLRPLVSDPAGYRRNLRIVLAIALIALLIIAMACVGPIILIRTTLGLAFEAMRSLG